MITIQAPVLIVTEVIVSIPTKRSRLMTARCFGTIWCRTLQMGVVPYCESFDFPTRGRHSVLHMARELFYIRLESSCLETMVNELSFLAILGSLSRRFVPSDTSTASTGHKATYRSLGKGPATFRSHVCIGKNRKECEMCTSSNHPFSARNTRLNKHVYPHAQHRNQELTYLYICLCSTCA